MEIENNTHDIIDNEFMIKKQIGRGATSEVFLAEHYKSKKDVAIKIFKPNFVLVENYVIKKEVYDNFNKEIDILEKLNHPNILKIIGYNIGGIIKLSNNLQCEIKYLILEYAEHSDLFDYIHIKNFEERIAKGIFLQIILGVKYLHDHNVVHRDLKTENIFVGENYNLKIGDFGFSNLINKDKSKQILKTKCGTCGYQSPELLENNNYNGILNDIFSLGVILFILVSGKRPFHEAKSTDKFYKSIMTNKIEKFWTDTDLLDLSPELRELIVNMLAYKNRWSINEIFECKWLNSKEFPSPNDIQEEMKIREKIVKSLRDERENTIYEVSNINTNLVYDSRGNTINEDLEKIKNELDALSFSYTTWNKDYPKLFFRFNALDFKKTLLTFISNVLYLNPKAKIILSKTKNFSALIELEEDEIFIEFEVGCYKDKNNKGTLIEIVKNSNTDYLTFINFLKEIKENMQKLD